MNSCMQLPSLSFVTEDDWRKKGGWASCKPTASIQLKGYKTRSRNTVGKGNHSIGLETNFWTFSLLLTWENNRRFCRNSILMTCHYPDLGIVLIGWKLASSNHADWSSVASSVWSFCGRSSDVISRRNQWRPHKVPAFFSGYYHEY